MKFVLTACVREKIKPVSEIKMYGKGNMHRWKKHVWFLRNRENTSNHAFFLMKLHGMKEEHCFNKSAPKETQMRVEFMSWSHEKFVGCAPLISRTRLFLKITAITNSGHWIFYFKHFFENLKNGSIYFLKRWPSMPDNADDFIQKFHYHWYNAPLLNLSMKQALKPTKELC